MRRTALTQLLSRDVQGRLGFKKRGGPCSQLKAKEGKRGKGNPSKKPLATARPSFPQEAEVE